MIVGRGLGAGGVVLIFLPRRGGEALSTGGGGLGSALAY